MSGLLASMCGGPAEKKPRPSPVHRLLRSEAALSECTSLTLPASEGLQVSQEKLRRACSFSRATSTGCAKKGLNQHNGEGS